MAWEAHLKNASHVVFSLHSPAGEQDYPGDLLVTVEYSLEPGNHLMVRMSASCTLATPLSMSARLPFNLAGQRSGPAGLASHHLMINARKFLETDKDGMLTGELRHSKHHGLLFLAPILMANAFQKGPADGFNHHLLLNGNPGDGLRFIARLSHRPSGRVVEIYSNTRCLHLDTLNKLTVPSVEGKEFAGEEEEEQELGVAPYGAEYGAGQYGVVQPPTLPPPPAQQMTDHFPIEGRPRSVSFTDQGDVQEHFGEYDYTETWGEDLTATTNAGEDADADIGGLLIEDTPAVRFLHELYAQGAVILAPEDYPDTIFEVSNLHTREKSNFKF
ncbi:hypothetical protein R5R35_001894 [Gryllus longicercus]|uniref:Galactose mutarotase n=1 Tax=Gryllus longicercus TaxID=2509291 RepID=A0AAN9Z546_9ORTH